MRETRDELRAFFGPLEPPPRRTPVQQLVKSLISNRTYDHVSVAAFDRLMASAPDWATLTRAPARELEARIAEVEFAERKADHLKATLSILSGLKPPFDIGFLAGARMASALTWLERLPGVGRKVAASVMNFSTFQRPALVIDSHLKRVLSRLGFAGASASPEAMYDAAMSAAGGWTARELTDLHVWMKRLGQTHCRPGRSACALCPLARRCRGPDGEGALAV